jgi:hypothetical protein
MIGYDIFDRFTVEQFPLRQRMTLTTKIYCSRLYRVSEVLPPARLTLLKNYETLGLHSLDIRLQMCVINFPLSLNSVIKIKKSILSKNFFSYTLIINIKSEK